ncbi:META domain-containing protein [Croceicoccus naphthovorans]|nr:META domain-containing protein [Croceicoccus naphthovorans]MBB3988710.1 heat shock protein HslJ [Croceicoccus naphthovorans]
MGMGLRNALIALANIAALALSGCGGEMPAQADEDVPVAAPSAEPEDETPSPNVAVGNLAPGFAPIAFDLAGSSWLVVAIDGKPLSDRYSDLATVHFTDTMIYWQACNHHEGLYVDTGPSFALGRITATLVACPAQSPDAELAQVLGGRPLIASNAEGKLMLALKGRTLTLSQIDSRYKNVAAPPLEAGPFRIMLADGGSRPPVLSFKGNNFSVWMDCPAAIHGKARVSNGQMRTSDIAVTTSCDSYRPTAIRSFGTFLSQPLSIARGPNGELLLTDGITVMHGQQCYPDASPCNYATKPAEKAPGT